MADQDSGGVEFFAGLVIGGLVGAALALLLAPQSGEETRAQLRDKSLEFKDRAEEGVMEARSRAQSQLASLQEQVTSLRVGSSIATTGGRWAIGRNISDSFAIVYPHESLRGSPVIVGESLEGGRYTARSGAFGPALSNTLASYVNQSVRYDAMNAPAGYDVGDGVLRVRPTYRSGYAIEVGSAAFVSALGRIHGNGGKPLALVSGRVRSLDDPDATTELFFTNSVGRFAVQKLEPGKRYRVELFTSPAQGFEFTVPADSDGLLDLATVVVPVDVVDE